MVIGCSCPPSVWDRRSVSTKVPGARPVVLTICNCDRRQCPQCKGYIWQLNGQKCPNGHHAG